MKMWIARNPDECLCMFDGKPVYSKGLGMWITGVINDHSAELPEEWFPEITFNNSPQEIELNYHINK